MTSDAPAGANPADRQAVLGQPQDHRHGAERPRAGAEEIRPGAVAWFPPGGKHRHGAAPATAMSHSAIQEKLDGSPVG